MNATAMQEATRLTREGRLMDATALIQKNLGILPPTATTEPAPGASGSGLLSRLRGLLPERDSSARRSDLGRRLQDVLPGSSLAGFGTEAAAAPGLTRRHYTGPAGERPYLLHVPDGVTGDAPLIVMLHGGTQDGASFAAATGMNALADEHGVIVAYPEQTRAANAMRYWNWFSPGDQRRGSGEAAILAGLIGELVTEFDVPAGQTFVAGFSAGAAMAAVLAEQYPDLVAGVGVHSGLASGAAHDVGSAFAAMRQAPRSQAAARPVPAIVFHGGDDQTVQVGNAREVVRQFCPRPTSHVSSHGQHGKRFTREVWTQTGPTSQTDGPACELWTVQGGGHAWAGGTPGGSYADPQAPNASREMVRFFLGR